MISDLGFSISDSFYITSLDLTGFFGIVQKSVGSFFFSGI